MLQGIPDARATNTSPQASGTCGQPLLQWPNHEKQRWQTLGKRGKKASPLSVTHRSIAVADITESSQCCCARYTAHITLLQGYAI